MQKSTLLFAAALAAMLIAAAPALAQTSDGSPTYALEGDQLIVDGDQAFDCPSLIGAVEQYGSGQPSGASVAAPQSEQVTRYARLCYQYGFSPSGGETPDAAAGSRTTAVPQSAPEVEPAQGSAEQVLPATGGVTLLVVALLAGVLALGVVGSAVRRPGR